MRLADRKRLIAAALLVAYEDGLDGPSFDLHAMRLDAIDLEERWAMLRSRRRRSYWLGEAARVLAAIEVGAKP